MRYVVMLLSICYGAALLAASSNEVPLGEMSDKTNPPKAPQVDIPQNKQPPLLQPYVTDTGKRAEMVNPDVGEPYAIIPSDDEHPDPLDESGEPTTDSQWQLLSW